MSNVRKEPEEDIRSKNEIEQPAPAVRGLGLSVRLREAARTVAGKRPDWLKFSRVREPGVRPKSVFVWLGRLRRKKP